jgi:hypothetical protein
VIAESVASAVCSRFGLHPSLRSVAYVAGWLNDPSAFQAGTAAIHDGAALLVAGHVTGVRAEPTQAPNQAPGELKSSCEQYDGTYIESKKDDVIACFWPDKGKTVCKYDGTGCYNYDPPKPKPNAGGGGAGPFGGFDWEATLEVAEDVDPGPAVGDGLDAAPSSERTKRRRRRGNRRQR